MEYEPYSVRYRLSCGHMLARCGRLYSRVSSRARGASPWSLEAGGGSDGSRTGNDIGQRPTSNDLALLSSRRTFFFTYISFSRLSGGGNRESGNGVFPVGVTASPRGGRARSGYAYGLWRLFISFLPPTADAPHGSTTHNKSTQDTGQSGHAKPHPPCTKTPSTTHTPLTRGVVRQTTDDRPHPRGT